MAHINYPAKVLFKSANPGKDRPPPPSHHTLPTSLGYTASTPAPPRPRSLSPPDPPAATIHPPSIRYDMLPVITMLIGLVWFRKRYPVRDYIVVALLVLGLYVFMNGDAKASPKGISSHPPRPLFEPYVDPSVQGLLQALPQSCPSPIHLSVSLSLRPSVPSPATPLLSPTRHRVRHLPRDAVDVWVGRGAIGAGALHAQVQRLHRGAALPLLPGQVRSLPGPVQPLQ
jgi:hypothetical protein